MDKRMRNCCQTRSRLAISRPCKAGFIDTIPKSCHKEWTGALHCYWSIRDVGEEGRTFAKRVGKKNPHGSRSTFQLRGVEYGGVG